MNAWGKVRLAVVGALLALPGRALALDDLVTPRALSMGGAAVGSANGALGPLLNPAGMTLMKQYTVEAFYGFDVQSLGSTLHASIVDNVTSRVAAGLYYTFVHGNPKLDYVTPSGAVVHNQVLREGHETGLSLALPFGDRFAFGITSKYTTVTTSAPNPLAGQEGQPASFVLDSTTATATASGFTMDAGLSLHLGDSFNIGLAGYNLVPLKSFDAPIGAGVGLAYLYNQTFMVTADARVAFDKYKAPNAAGQIVNKPSAKLGLGAEYLAGGVVPIRIGVSHDTGVSATYVSTGIGYMGRTFGIDIAYRQQVAHGIDSQLMAGLRLFLE